MSPLGSRIEARDAVEQRLLDGTMIPRPVLPDPVIPTITPCVVRSGAS